MTSFKVYVLLTTFAWSILHLSVAKREKSFFGWHNFKATRSSDEFAFCRVENETEILSCLDSKSCERESGVSRGNCGSDKVCCEVQKFCDSPFSTTSAHSVLFRNPMFPSSEVEDRACSLRIKVPHEICALRFDNEIFELSKFDDEICTTDTLTILGTKNFTAPICGNMTGYSTTFAVEEFQKVTIALVLQGSPAPYRFSIRIMMVPCDDIIPFRSMHNSGQKNLDASKYKIPMKNSTESNKTASTSKDGNSAAAETSKNGTSSSTPTSSTPDSPKSGTDSSKKPSGPGTIRVTRIAPLSYEKGCHRNNTQPIAIMRSMRKTPRNSIFTKRYEEILREKFGNNYESSSSEDEERLSCSIVDDTAGQVVFKDIADCNIEDLPTPQNKFRVVGGKYANVAEWPWVVALVYKLKYFCSGSLLTDKIVITAGHCLFGGLHRGIDHISVLIGDFDLNSTIDTPSLSVGVKRILWNPHYNPNNIDNDIALLEICKPIEFSYSISPIKLPASSDYDYAGRHAVTVGWGSTTGQRKNPSRILKEHHSTIVDSSICQKLWSALPIIGARKDMHICLNITKGTPCYGDSGGPLVTCIGSDCTLVGLVSFSFPKCVNVGLPAVYTNVAYFKPWIDMSLTSIAPMYIIP